MPRAAQHATGDPFSFAELAETLPKKMQPRLWKGLSAQLERVLDTVLDRPDLDAVDEENMPSEVLEGLGVVDAVVAATAAALAVKKPAVCPEMVQAVRLLHCRCRGPHAPMASLRPSSCRASRLAAHLCPPTPRTRAEPNPPTVLLGAAKLLLLPANYRRMRDRAAKIGEAWWSAGLKDKEAVVPQTVTYLLMNGLAEGARASDVKRIFAFREALLVLDFEDESSATLRHILQQCAISPLFLGVGEGKRFLSYLFGLHPSLIDGLHATIKSTLPLCPKGFLDDYGEVYFRAWRSASGVYLQRIEAGCVQDLMDRAVHAQRGAGGGLAASLRRVLQGFHGKKKERGVDEMLNRLYAPVIWRALKVANPAVRANAASLLIDAFPLTDPEATRAEGDELIQRQVEALKTLLQDESPLVRATGVEGVCRVASVYWELLPPATIGALLGKVVGDLARDASAASVRVAVVKGLTYLLGNHLSVPLLKKLLPQMQDLCHDPSDKVRGAFLDMLVTVKGIRDIKFWDVTPVEHLLARLAHENRDNASKIVKLLAPTYFPQKKSDEERVDRCVALVRDNLPAGRRFYQLLADHTGASVLARFAVVLSNCVRTVLADVDPLQESFVGGAGSGAVDGDLAPEDAPALMDVVAVIVTGFTASGAGDKSTFKKLQKALQPTLEAVFSLREEGGALAAAAMLIARAFPASIGKSVGLDVTAELRQLPPGSGPAVYLPLLECAVGWGMDADVVRLCNTWVGDALESIDGELAGGKRTAKGKKKAKASLEAHPSLGLAYLDGLVSIYARTGSAAAAKRFSSSLKMLQGSLDLIRRRMDGEAMGSVSDTILAQCVRVYLRICLCAHGDKSPAVDTLTSVVEWASEVLVAAVAAQRPATAGGARAASRKRKGSTKDQAPALDAGRLVHVVVDTTAEAVTLGVHSAPLVQATAAFAMRLLGGCDGASYVPGLAKFVAQASMATHGDPLSHPYDKPLRDTAAALLAAAATDASGAAAQSAMPLLTATAKALQQRRMLGTLMEVMAEAVVDSVRSTVNADVSEAVPDCMLPVLRFCKCCVRGQRQAAAVAQVVRQRSPCPVGRPSPLFVWPQPSATSRCCGPLLRACPARPATLTSRTWSCACCTTSPPCARTARGSTRATGRSWPVPCKTLSRACRLRCVRCGGGLLQTRWSNTGCAARPSLTPPPHGVHAWAGTRGREYRSGGSCHGKGALLQPPLVISMGRAQYTHIIWTVQSAVAALYWLCVVLVAEGHTER